VLDEPDVGAHVKVAVETAPSGAGLALPPAPAPGDKGSAGAGGSAEGLGLGRPLAGRATFGVYPTELFPALAAPAPPGPAAVAVAAPSSGGAVGGAAKGGSGSLSRGDSRAGTRRTTMQQDGPGQGAGRPPALRTDDSDHPDVVTALSTAMAALGADGDDDAAATDAAAEIRRTEQVRSHRPDTPLALRTRTPRPHALHLLVMCVYM